MRYYLLKLIYKKSLHNRINDRKKKKTSAEIIEFIEWNVHTKKQTCIIYWSFYLMLEIRLVLYIYIQE
jgi:hypothetical protein